MALATINSGHQLTYCFNARAANYPGFTGQVRQVLWQHEAVLGVKWIEIPGSYETPAAAKAAGCQVQHNMPEVHGCSECAAWVHYLNWPVLIEYRWQAGYNPTNGWFTTISHETGHIYGLHEHYDDANFLSYRGTYGRWAHGMLVDPGTQNDSPTVMDFGTGFWEFTPYDIKQSCQLLTGGFVGCSTGEVFGPCDPSWDGCWSEQRQRWVGMSGALLNYEFDPVTGIWTNPEGLQEWCCEQSYGGRYNQWRKVWVWDRPTTWEWHPEESMWRCASNCP